MCNVLGVDGGHLPDEGFYDPTVGTESSPALDIFSLGALSVTQSWPELGLSDPPAVSHAAGIKTSMTMKFTTSLREGNFLMCQH